MRAPEAMDRESLAMGVASIAAHATPLLACALGGPAGTLAMGIALLPWIARAGTHAGWVSPALLGRLRVSVVPAAALLGLGVMLSAPADAAPLALAAIAAGRGLADGADAPERVGGDLALSALILALAATRTESLVFLPLFLVFAAAAPVVLSGGVVPARAGVLAALGALLWFPVLPRFTAAPPPAPLAAAPSVTGFSDEVGLGELGALADDPTAVLRLRANGPLAGPVYLRGAALDHFDGRGWRRSDPRDPMDVPPLPGGGGLVLSVSLLRDFGGTLFTSGRLLGGEPQLGVAADGTLSGPGIQAYRVAILPPLGPGGPFAAPESPDPRWLRTAGPEITALAGELAGDAATPLARVERIRAALRAGWTYTRETPASERAPLAAFLFEHKSGHCESFATAMALLARGVGVPSRVATGFAGGEPTPLGDALLFRAAHAHAWTEVLIPGEGWRIVDATPLGPPGEVAAAPFWAPWWESASEAWSGTILSYDGAGQRRFAWGVARPTAEGGGGLWWAGLGAAVLLSLSLRRRRAPVAAAAAPPVSGAMAGIWRRAREHTIAAGHPIPEELPPLAAAEWLVARVGPAAEPVLRLAELHYAVRYGDLDDREAARAAGPWVEAWERAIARPADGETSG